jgi:TatA/E family protein of Tat protein translocase
MGPLGGPEIIFIVLLALLLFGPKKLPELGRLIGRALTEYRRATSELKSTFEREMRNLERETEGLKETAKSHFQDSYNYDYSAYDTTSSYPTELPPSPSLQLNEGSTPGASAASGAESTLIAEHAAPTITRASGTIASGSLHEDPSQHAEQVMVAEHETVRQESATS